MIKLIKVIIIADWVIACIDLVRAIKVHNGMAIFWIVVAVTLLIGMWLIFSKYPDILTRERQ